jgi:hypothetical protein
MSALLAISRSALLGASLLSACGNNVKPADGSSGAGAVGPLPSAGIGAPVAGVAAGDASLMAGSASPIAGMGSAIAGRSSVSAGTGGVAAGTGSTTAGAGGTAAGTGGSTAGASGSAGSGGSVSTPGDCSSLPPVTDYAAKGPFADAKMFASTGPSSNYTLFRPDASLGKDGFKHPIATWGNGIATTPDNYTQTLTQIASHGFVIIACNDTMAERPCLSAGLDWLVAQNATGPMQGKLDTTREVTIGYSWGGGAAIDTSDRPNVKATVSLHGMPPRQTGAFDMMHSPLLLFTSTGDSFVTASGYVTPNYDKSKVQTFYATLADATAGHLYVADVGSVACVASAALGECKGAMEERAPTIAWLRYWVCGDQGAKKFFYTDDCVLCKTPWTMPQRKNWN